MQEPSQPEPRSAPRDTPRGMAAAAIAWLGLVLVLEGVVCALYASWEMLNVWVQGSLLALVPLLLWGAYFVCLRRGVRLGRFAGVLACLSWLAALLIVHFCVYPMPLPLLGALFLLGAALPPMVRPAASSFIVAAFAGGFVVVLQAVNLWLHGEAELFFPWVQIWATALTLLALWAQAGVWCALTRRPGYAAFAFVAPLAYGLFLALWVGGLMASLYLHSLGVGGLLSGGDVWGSTLLWLIPVALLPLLHLRVVRGTERAYFSLPALAFFLAHLLAVPVGCLAMVNEWFLPIFLMIAGLGVAISVCGFRLRSRFLLVSGCVVVIAPSFCVLLSGMLRPVVSSLLFSISGLAALVWAVAIMRKNRVLRVPQSHHIPPAVEGDAKQRKSIEGE